MNQTKTILALWHAADKGKTETLRAFAIFLLQQYPQHQAVVPVPAVVPQSGDFRLVVRIKNKVVAVESQGDPNTDLQDRLEELVNQYEADIILCSTRTKGDTVDAVEHLCSTYGYDSIWTSTYQAEDNQSHSHRTLNDTKGKHLLDLLQTLQLI